jgi:hypothetical protein
MFVASSMHVPRALLALAVVAVIACHFVTGIENIRRGRLGKDSRDLLDALYTSANTDLRGGEVAFPAPTESHLVGLATVQICLKTFLSLLIVVCTPLIAMASRIRLKQSGTTDEVRMRKSGLVQNLALRFGPRFRLLMVVELRTAVFQNA